MSPIYKRVKYQKQNGFDVPYWDIETIPSPSPIPVCPPESGYECLNVSGFTGVNTWANGDYTFFNFGFLNIDNQIVECGCEYEYAIYQHNTKPWITLCLYYDISGSQYIYSFRHNGFLGSPEDIICDTEWNSSALILNPTGNSVPTQQINDRFYPTETTILGGVITYVSCVSPTPSTTPSITPTSSITPSITSTPPLSKSTTPTTTPTITNTPSITPTITPTETPKASISPTPTPTPTASDPCPCGYYSVYNNSGTETLSVEYVDCDTFNTEILVVGTKATETLCSCSAPIRVFGSTDYTITYLGSCPT